MKSAYVFATVYVVIFIIAVILIIVYGTKTTESVDLSDPDTFNTECTVGISGGRANRCKLFCEKYIGSANPCDYKYCAILPKYMSTCSICAKDWSSADCQLNWKEYCKLNKIECDRRCMNSKTCAHPACDRYTESLVCSDASLNRTRAYSQAPFVNIISDGMYLSTLPDGRVSTEDSVYYEWRILRNKMRVALVTPDGKSVGIDGIVHDTVDYVWLIVNYGTDIYIRGYDNDTVWLCSSGVCDRENALTIEFGSS